MNLARRLAALALLLPAIMVGCKSEPEKPLTVTDTAQVSVTAKVKAIDYPARLITLEDSAGNNTMFLVDSAVQRLNEVRVGDSVKADFRVTLVAELRKPTAEEAANPISTTTSMDRAPQDASPSGGYSSVTKVVTTVTAVDLPGMLVTLKGPMGDTTTVRAHNPDNVKKLHVGDTIVITYTRAMAISLVKVPG